MSRFEPRPRLMEDVKHTNPATTPVDKDVEAAPPPPSYPLNETEELVVGDGTRFPRFIHWIKAHRSRRCGGCHAEDNGRRSKRSKILRAIKFIFAAWMLLTLIHITTAGITTYKTITSLKCVAITPGEHLDGFDVTIPFRHSKHIIVHDSLSGGDAVITHDDSVDKGTVKLAVTFANGTKPDAVYDGCMSKFKGATVLGLIPRAEGGDRAQISTFSIRVPTSLSHPSVRFLGKGDKHVSDKKLQRIIRWWKRYQDKKGKKDKKNKQGKGVSILPYDGPFAQ